MTEPTEALINQTRHDNVLLLELNRPDAMNALSPDLVSQLRTALEEADHDEDVRAIVLTGVGAAFSAGFDMARRREVPPTRDAMIKDWYTRDSEGVRDLLAIMEMSTPVIAAVNGWCLGGGFWYALACDITLAAESAVFAQPEVRHVSNTTFLFGALVGWKHAHRYGLTGDHFDAQEALRIGVVNEVVPDDELLEKAMALAARLALVPRASIRYNKAVTNMGLQAAGLRAGMILNGALSALAHSSGDSDDTAHLHQSRQEGDMRTFLKLRDTPFRPEPGGPRSKA